MIYAVKHADQGRRFPAWPAVLGCALAAVGFLLLWRAAVTDPVRMPTVPAPLAGAAAIVAAALIGGGARSSAPLRPVHLVLASLSAATMLAGSLFALPHTILMAIAWVGAGLTGGSGPFQVEPSWPATVVHLTTLAASAAVLAWLLRQYRCTTGRCLACGRRRPDLPAPRAGSRPWWRNSGVLAAVAIAASLPYAAFKVIWSAGGTVGLIGAGFDEVGFASPGFGDTLLLTGVSVAACLVMGSGLAGTTALRRTVRFLTLGIGAIGSLMLLPAGAVAIGMLAPVALGRASIDDSVIAPWAFAVIYLSFVLWGLALATSTLHYRSATRPPCRHHRPAPADILPGAEREGGGERQRSAVSRQQPAAEPR